MSPSEKTQPRLASTTQEVPATSAGTAAEPGRSVRAERSGGGSSPASSAPVGPPPTTTAPEPDEREVSGGQPAPARVRLTVARVAPWSVAKLAFLLSVALGVVFVVAVALLWSVLQAMGVFADVNGVITEVLGSETEFDLLDIVGLGRVVSMAVFIAVVDVVLLTALATLGAVLYNLASALVGGLQLTLSDD